MQLTWGARPPRAQWAAPSRPTTCTQSVHCLVRACMPRFGARARRTAAEAAALPIDSNSIVPASGRFTVRTTGARGLQKDHMDCATLKRRKRRAPFERVTLVVFALVVMCARGQADQSIYDDALQN